jgi:hypothetical protein
MRANLPIGSTSATSQPTGAALYRQPFNRETFQMKEIKPDQRWSEGVNEVQVTNAFGVRIRIRRSGAQADEEITEDDFRKCFTFVAER